MDLRKIHRDIIACTACPRLIKHCRLIAREKRKAYANEEYWGKPVPGFGVPNARLVILGLAPAAHGANRTGRIFTGDRSGDWLYRALHKAGFANQPTSKHRNDGLELIDTYITCMARCAPPDNKPLPAEIKRCSPFLSRELDALTDARVYLALGRIALDGAWPRLVEKLGVKVKKPAFTHGGKHEIAPERWLLLSYHPSQQNTFTGRLTEPMFDSVFSAARALIRNADL